MSKNLGCGDEMINSILNKSGFKGKMREDIINYLRSEIERRCKLPTNFFGMGCYYHIESVVKNAELLAKQYGADIEIVIMALQ